MSGLTLYGDFFKAAALAQSGSVRLAAGTDDKLVNTGTLGNRIVSVAGHDKAELRQKTLDAFKAALADGFGDGAAAAAFKDLGLDKAGAKLTGKLVFAAAKSASANLVAIRGATMAANTAANEAALQRFLPPPATTSRPGATVPPAPPTTGGTVDPASLKAALAQLAPSAAPAYAQRLREAVDQATSSGLRRLDGQELEQLAWRALEEAGTDPPVADAAAKKALDATAAADSRPPVTAAAKDEMLLKFTKAMTAAVAAETVPPPADPPPPHDAPPQLPSAKDDVASRFAAAFDDYVATAGTRPETATGGSGAVPLRDLPPIPVNPPPALPDLAATKRADTEVRRASEQVDDARLARLQA